MDNTVSGCIYFYARRYDEALAQFDKAIQLNPDFFVTYYHLAWLYAQLGNYPSAITELSKGRLLAGDDRAASAASQEATLRKAFVAQGPRGFWQQIQRDGEMGEFGSPQVYARLGDKEKALASLERDYEERETLGTLMNVDPAFDSLRADPRFLDLVQRMGLTPGATGDRRKATQ
jgi:tetratricopeptide (TPR) repeat protein